MVITPLQDAATLHEGDATERLQGFVLLLIPCLGMVHLSGVRCRGSIMSTSNPFHSGSPLLGILYFLSGIFRCSTLQPAVGLHWLIALLSFH